MKLAIVGGRSFGNQQLFDKAMANISGIDAIVSGGASGADMMAKLYAQKNNIPYIEHPAKWGDLVDTPENPVKIATSNAGTKYNRLAGFTRNTLIVRDCDAVLAFWDQKSPGTSDTISKALTKGKPVVIVNYKNDSVSVVDPATGGTYRIGLEEIDKKLN